MATPENKRTDVPALRLAAAVDAQRRVSESARAASEEAQREREREPTTESEEGK